LFWGRAWSAHSMCGSQKAGRLVPKRRSPSGGVLGLHALLNAGVVRRALLPVGFSGIAVLVRPPGHSRHPLVAARRGVAFMQHAAVPLQCGSAKTQHAAALMQRGSVKAQRGVAVLQRGSAKEQNEPVAALDEPGKELAERGGRPDEPVGGLPGPVFVLSLKI
jgi:hypothetical protein